MIELTKEQKKEIQKQEECKHKNTKTKKIKDKKMLNGFYEDKICLDCGCRFMNFKIQIAYIMEAIARDKRLKKLDDVTAKMLSESNYLKPNPTIEQAEYLIKNKEKFI